MTNHGSQEKCDTSVKEEAYSCADKILYNQAKNTLVKEVRVAKRNYSEKLRTSLLDNDLETVWKGLKDITNYTSPPHSVDRQQLADNLNMLYCTFKKNPAYTLFPQVK